MPHRYRTKVKQIRHLGIKFQRVLAHLHKSKKEHFLKCCTLGILSATPECWPGCLDIVFGNYALSYLLVTASLILARIPWSKFLLLKVHFSNSQGSMRGNSFYLSCRALILCSRLYQDNWRWKNTFSSSPTLGLFLLTWGSHQKIPLKIMSSMFSKTWTIQFLIILHIGLPKNQSHSFWVIVVFL